MGDPPHEAMRQTRASAITMRRMHEIRPVPCGASQRTQSGEWCVLPVMRPIGLLLGVLAVAGCGAYQSSAPPRPTTGNAVQPRTRATAPTNLHLLASPCVEQSVVLRWLGSDPHRLRVPRGCPRVASAVHCRV